MAGASFVAGAPAPVAALVTRPRFVRSRSIEKEPPRHGERPYEQLVRAAFDGPVLRLSEKLKLLEEADNRHIRRGDALDLIAAVRGELEETYRVRPHGRLHHFMTRYAIFVACYAMFAAIWVVILARH
jgi:hypothetical protein